jgi:sulfopyruvate decarboxylase TPP-binding subunit
MSSASSSPEPKWLDALYECLREHGVTQLDNVPDAGQKSLINRALADPEMNTTALAMEEEGVAMLAGADLDPAACRNRFRSALSGKP